MAAGIVGFVTLEEYRAMPLARYGDHAACETPKHAGQRIPAVAVVALIEGQEHDVWGVCAGCFAGMDDAMGTAAWHLPAGE